MAIYVHTFVGWLLTDSYSLYLSIVKNMPKLLRHLPEQPSAFELIQRKLQNKITRSHKSLGTVSITVTSIYNTYIYT